jgi:hypothetical protein
MCRPTALALEDPAPRSHDLAQILARGRPPCLGQRQEEDIVGPVEAAACGELGASGLQQLPGRRREEPHETELRRLPRADERTNAAQNEPEDESLRSVHARQQRAHHLRCLALGSGELPIRDQGVVTQPDVVGERPEDVRRVLRPALYADVDLADRTEAIAAQERGEPVLHGHLIEVGQLVRRADL